jgi:hypothetical protein
VVAYSGTFRAVEQSGEYQVQAEIMAILPGGRVFHHEIAPVPLSIVVPPTPTSSPTAVPTPLPTPVPTATPTPVSLFSTFSGSPYCIPGILVLLVLLLLLILVVVLRRRRRRSVPDKIKLLAELMRSRRESGESPYVLILGSGPAMTLGSGSMRRVVKSITGGTDLKDYYDTLNGLSSLERSVILRKHFAETDVSSGYRRLAKLVEEEFFDVIFTTGLDPFLEKALAEGKETANFAVIICGLQSSVETLDILERTKSRIKIVKLHGDIRSRSFAFTPSEISRLGSEAELVLSRYLTRDLIIVGHGSHDYDINRAIEGEGGAIWYVEQDPPAVENSVYQAMRARGTQTNIISGEFGMFDRFFDALYSELTRFR